jgi:hypothetical protein
VLAQGKPFDAILAKLAELQTQVADFESGSASSVSALQTQIADLAQSLTTATTQVQNDIADLEDSLNSAVSSLQSQIAALEDSQGVSGPWSRKLAPADRFELVLDDEGVLDKETGIVWARSPFLLSTGFSFEGARSKVSLSAIGGRAGWRLPTRTEITTIVDIEGWEAVQPSLGEGDFVSTLPKSGLFNLGDATESSRFLIDTTYALQGNVSTFLRTITIQFRGSDNNPAGFPLFSRTSSLPDPVWIWPVRGGSEYDAQQGDLVSN